MELPLELQSLILTYISDLSEILSIARTLPILLPLIYDTVKVLDQITSIDQLRAYVGPHHHPCRLTQINDYLPILSIDDILFLSRVGQLRTLNLLLPGGDADLIHIVLGGYWARHGSWADLTLRCKWIDEPRDFLYFHRGSLYVNQRVMEDGYSLRLEEARGKVYRFYTEINSILKPYETLSNLDDATPDYKAPSVIILPYLDSAAFGIEVRHLMGLTSRLHLSLISTLNSDSARSFISDVSVGINADLMFDLNDLGQFSHMIIFNFPVHISLLERLTTALPNLEMIGLLGESFSDEQIAIIVNILRRHPRLTLNVFTGAPKEDNILPPHPRIKYIRGGGYPSEVHPPPPGHENEYLLSPIS